MFITIQQIKAARALLDWNQGELATAAGLNVDQVRNFEAGRSRSLDVVEAIHAAFDQQGITLENGGAVPRHIHSYILESYLDLLTDICRTLPDGGEVLKHCEDDRLCTKVIMNKLEEMLQAGIRERLTISEDNDLVLRNPSQYRRIPAKYCSSTITTLVYANKTAFFSEDKAIVIVNSSLASHMRDQFEYWWKHGTPV